MLNAVLVIKKMKFFILLFCIDIVFGIFPELPTDCNKFIVGHCEPNSEEIISK